MKKVLRLDKALLEKYPELTRAQAASYIMQGRVRVGDLVVTKAGTGVAANARIDLELPEVRFVSRAGYKLEAALNQFNLDISGRVVLDAGLSTGGFTDCLLQRSVARVYGVDVGYGQVHEKIRHDPRVIVMERTNLRYVEALPEKVSLVTLDLSFISVIKVLPAVVNLMTDDADLIILIKPQFEAGKSEIERGGLVTDPAVHERVIREITTEVIALGFACVGVIPSPLTGTDGNQEFLGVFHRTIVH